MARGKSAGNYTPRHFLRTGEPLFHQGDDGLRGGVRQDAQQALFQVGAGRRGAELPHLPFPGSLWRGLQQHQHPHQRTDGGRLGHGAQQLALLRPWQPFAGIYRSGARHQGDCHLCHQRRRRLWRYVCAFALHRGIRGLLLLKALERQWHQHLSGRILPCSEWLP